MNRVADKNGILAATRYRETAACGSGEGASSPHQRFAYSEPMSTARRATPVAATTRYWRSQPIAGAAACNPLQHRTLSRTVSVVLLLAKGITIRIVTFLAMPSRHVTAQQPIAGARAGRPSRTKCYAPRCPACHPAKLSARSCWSYSEVP